MQLLFGEEDMWEAYTPPLSPLRALKPVPDPLEILGIPETWQIRATSPFEFSDSESDSGSDDISFSSISPTFQGQYLPGDMAPVDWGATETFPRLADNALGLDVAPSQMRAVEARAVTTSTPQARSLRAPINHQDAPGRGRPNQKCHAPRRHATPQSYDTASKTLVEGCLQATGVRGEVSNTSGPKKSKGMSPRVKAHPYGRATKPRRNYGPDDWLSSGDPKKRVDHDDALSTCAVLAEESNNKPERAPLMRPVALPDDMETSNAASEKLLYSGPDLGGWLTGTFDGVPKMLDLLGFALPVPFPVDEALLGSI